MAAIATDMTTEICRSLHSQLGSMFECITAGDRVQIRTPFVLPDGHQIDVYWRDTPWGQVVSDLGDTYGWIFVNGAYDRLTPKQDEAYYAACSAYGVERFEEAILARVSDGGLADAVVRLAQAITTVSNTLDVGEQPADVFTENTTRQIATVGHTLDFNPRPAGASTGNTARQITASRIAATIEKYQWDYKRNIKLTGRTKYSWNLDYFVHTKRQDAALMALHGRKYAGWQRRAIEHAFTVFSDLAPVLREQGLPLKAISVIDDNDVHWYNEPIELLSEVSEIVHLSVPDGLATAIAGELA